MKITYLVEGASFTSVIWKSHPCIKPFILLNFQRCEVNHVGDKSPIFIDKWLYGTCKGVDHFSCSPCICSKSWVQLALAHILPMGSINWHCGCFHNHSLLAHLGELFALNRNIYQLFIYARDWEINMPFLLHICIVKNLISLLIKCSPSFRRNWGMLLLWMLEVFILILVVLLNSGWFPFLWHRLGRRWCAVINTVSKSLYFERRIHGNDCRHTIETWILWWDAQVWPLQYQRQNWLSWGWG